MISSPKLCDFKNAEGSEYPFIDDEGYYRQMYLLRWYSERYDKWLTVPIGYPMDGASGPAVDICSEAWPLHDKATPEPDKSKWPKCAFGWWEDDGKWDDGSDISLIQGSFILYDKLRQEGRWFRARTWFVATLVAGKWREMWRKAR